MQLIGIAASTRSGSVNRALYEHVAGAIEARGHKVTTLDYAIVENLPLYSATRERDDGVPESIRNIAAQILDADGLAIATPEYNFSLPGPLKNAIDWLSRVKPYVTIGKPVLLMSASGSPIGGWRGLAALRTPLACLGAQVLAWDITVGGAPTAPDVGRIVATQAMQERIALAVAQLR